MLIMVGNIQFQALHVNSSLPHSPLSCAPGQKIPRYKSFVSQRMLARRRSSLFIRSCVSKALKTQLISASRSVQIKRACGKSGRTTIRLNKNCPSASCAFPNPLPSECNVHCANPGDTGGSWAGITATPLRDNGASHFIVLITLTALGERWGEGKGGFSTELGSQFPPSGSIRAQGAAGNAA